MGFEAKRARAPLGDQQPRPSSAAAANNRTLPKCVRCRNHNEVSLLSGHKRFCRYRHCICKDCLRTVNRQKKMAMQIADRRRKKLEDERAERGEPVPARTPTPPPPSSSIASVETPPTVPSRWFPYSDKSERSRHGAYEQNVSSTSSMSGISSSNSNVPYAASCQSPTGSVISVTALSDTDGAWPSDQRLRLSEAVARHSPGPVDLESVARLTGLVRRHNVDTEALLYVILNIVCPNVDEAYNKILTAQEEIRSLRGSLSPSPPLSVSGRPGEAVTSSIGSPPPPAPQLYRTHNLPPPPSHPAAPVFVPRVLGPTYYPAHLPLFGPIPTRIPLGLTAPFSHLSSLEEQYRPGSLRAASLLTNV